MLINIAKFIPDTETCIIRLKNIEYIITKEFKLNRQYNRGLFVKLKNKKKLIKIKTLNYDEYYKEDKLDKLVFALNAGQINENND